MGLAMSFLPPAGSPCDEVGSGVCRCRRQCRPVGHGVYADSDVRTAAARWLVVCEKETADDGYVHN
jgi:hypothetical protein